MKETVKAIFLLAVIYLVLFFLVKTNRQSQVIQEKPETKTITVTETLTQVMYDTLFIEHFETVKLRTTDTIVIDSLRIDSIEVEVPISVYKFDSTFTTDTTVFNLSIRNLGYDVKLDSLFYEFKYTPRPIKLPKKNYFRDHFRFGVGVSSGYGFFSKQSDIFVGVGVYYVF